MNGTNERTEVSATDRGKPVAGGGVTQGEGKEGWARGLLERRGASSGVRGFSAGGHSLPRITSQLRNSEGTSFGSVSSPAKWILCK